MSREDLKIEYDRLLQSFGMRTLDPVALDAEAYRRKYEQTNDRPFLSLMNAVPVDWTKRGISGEAFWELMDNEVQKSAKQLGYEIPLETYVNVFPTGSFNAQACRVAAGALILVNVGLMGLVYKLMKLLTRSLTIATGYDAEGRPRLKGDGTDEVVSRGEDVSTEIAETLAAYLTYGDPSEAKKLPAPTGDRGLFTLFLTQYVEKFVLAHEYGHVIAGHLSTPKRAISHTPAGDLAVVSKSWQEELEADMIACNIMLAGCGTVKRTEEGSLQLLVGEDNRMVLVSVVGAIGIFFAIDELIESVKLAVTGSSEIVIVTDHPPSDMRKRILLDTCRNIGGDFAADSADQLAGWIRVQADGTVYRLTHSDLLRQR